jgi:hypothetical protein
MTDDAIPIWAISTSNTEDRNLVPDVLSDMPLEGFTLERLERLRRVLAVYADNPPVMLERYAVTVADVPEGGRVVAASSPILKTLNNVVGKSKTVTATEQAAGATGVVYRMVVPKEVAGDLASGLARPMKAAAGGQYSSILGKTGVVAHARYVPVASAGGATGAAATATTAAGIGGAVVAAAPVVILLAATAASVYAEEQRRQALERLQTTLDEIKLEGLDKERDQLNGAVKAIAKATSVLADEGDRHRHEHGGGTAHSLGEAAFGPRRSPDSRRTQEGAPLHRRQGRRVHNEVADGAVCDRDKAACGGASSSRTHADQPGPDAGAVRSRAAEGHAGAGRARGPDRQSPPWDGEPRC